jgi:hypothetical protein
MSMAAQNASISKCVVSSKCASEPGGRPPGIALVAAPDIGQHLGPLTAPPVERSRPPASSRISGLHRHRSSRQRGKITVPMSRPSSTAPGRPPKSLEEGPHLAAPTRSGGLTNRVALERLSSNPPGSRAFAAATARSTSSSRSPASTSALVTAR